MDAYRQQELIIRQRQCIQRRPAGHFSLRPFMSQINPRYYRCIPLDWLKNIPGIRRWYCILAIDPIIIPIVIHAQYIIILSDAFAQKSPHSLNIYADFPDCLPCRPAGKIPPNIKCPLASASGQNEHKKECRPVVRKMQVSYESRQVFWLCFITRFVFPGAFAPSDIVKRTRHYSGGTASVLHRFPFSALPGTWIAYEINTAFIV